MSLYQKVRPKELSEIVGGIYKMAKRLLIEDEETGQIKPVCVNFNPGTVNGGSPGDSQEYDPLKMTDVIALHLGRIILEAIQIS